MLQSEGVAVSMEKMQYSLFGVHYIKLVHTEEAAGGFMETHTMLVVSKGSGDLYLNGVRHRLKAKAICYCPPGTIADIRRTPNSSVPLELYEWQYDVWEIKERTTSRIVYGKRITARWTPASFPSPLLTRLLCWFKNYTNSSNYPESAAGDLQQTFA